MKVLTAHWTSMLASLLVGIVLSGCATSMQGNNLSAIETFPEVHPRKSVSLDLAFAGRLNGKPWSANDAHNTEYLKNLSIQHLQESDMFRVVTTRRVPLDLELKVAIINEKTTSPNRQILTALRLFIVPYKSTDTFQLLAVVKNPKTGEQKKIKLEESVSHWQQLFLVPFSLFNRPDDELEKCRVRLLDNLCMEIYNSGMIK